MTESEDKESLARAQLPFRAEYCKTSRAKCKKCTEKMEANSLKLAVMTKSPFHDGYDPTYYHVPCFFRVKRPSSVAEIRHFETLKYEDQKMLEKAVETNGQSVLGISNTDTNNNDNGKAKPKGKKASKRGASSTSNEQLVNYEDYVVEYSKSSRAVCIHCQEKIEKSLIRFGKLDYNAETPFKAGPVPRWHHLECFVKSIDKLEFYGEVKKIPGFGNLEAADRKMLEQKVKPQKPKPVADSGAKKIKTDPEEERLLKEQSDRFFKLRDFVNTMKRKDIELMLEFMNQKHNYKVSSILIDMATDVLLFGPLKNCPRCKQIGTMVLRGTSYICTGGGETDPCNYETKQPLRDAPDVPDEVVEKYPFFEDEYEFRGGERIFPSVFVKAVEQKEAEDNNTVMAGAPLEGLSIGVISWGSIRTEKGKVQKKIITLGGKLQTSLDKSLFVILSNKDELEKDTPKIEVAKALGVPFATEGFLFKIESKDDVVPQLSKCLIGEWDGDLDSRFNNK